MPPCIRAHCTGAGNSRGTIRADRQFHAPTQPEDLVKYAAVYFAAVAGIALPGHGGSSVGGGGSGMKSVTDVAPVLRRLTDEVWAAAVAEHHFDTSAVDAAGAAVIDSGATAPAAWDVDGRGDELCVAPLAHHYARRTSEINMLQAAESGTAEASPSDPAERSESSKSRHSGSQ